jgi:hypothetical protein
MMSDIIHDQTVAMQSAIIEWQHGKGAEAGLNWIVKTLAGPGHLPDFRAPQGKHARFWFNANQASPLRRASTAIRRRHSGWDKASAATSTIARPGRSMTLPARETHRENPVSVCHLWARLLVGDHKDIENRTR